jgi:hypothetical protein
MPPRWRTTPRRGRRSFMTGVEMDSRSTRLKGYWCDHQCEPARGSVGMLEEHGHQQFSRGHISGCGRLPLSALHLCLNSLRGRARYVPLSVGAGPMGPHRQCPTGGSVGGRQSACVMTLFPLNSDRIISNEKCLGLRRTVYDAHCRNCRCRSAGNRVRPHQFGPVK